MLNVLENDRHDRWDWARIVMHDIWQGEGGKSTCLGTFIVYITYYTYYTCTYLTQTLPIRTHEIKKRVLIFLIFLDRMGDSR